MAVLTGYQQSQSRILNASNLFNEAEKPDADVTTLLKQGNEHFQNKGRLIGDAILPSTTSEKAQNKASIRLR